MVLIPETAGFYFHNTGEIIVYSWGLGIAPFWLVEQAGFAVAVQMFCCKEGNTSYS